MQRVSAGLSGTIFSAKQHRSPSLHYRHERIIYRSVLGQTGTGDKI